MLILLCNVANAGLISVNNPGNDNDDKVSALVGKPVFETGKFDDIKFHDGGVTLVEEGSAVPNALFFTTSSSGYLTQGIDYDFFAVKAGPFYNLYSSDGFRSPWVTPFFKDLSHVTLYKCYAPEPGSLLLFGIGFVLLLGRYRKCLA